MKRQSPARKEEAEEERERKQQFCGNGKKVIMTGEAIHQHGAWHRIVMLSYVCDVESLVESRSCFYHTELDAVSPAPKDRQIVL